MSLYLSFFDECKTFNVVDVGISSAVNPVVAKPIYMMSELCRSYHVIFIHQFSNFYTAEI